MVDHPPNPEKYAGEVWKVDDGESIPDGEWILFRVKDRALPATLFHYHQICLHLGASRDYLDGILALADRVEEWQLAHPDEVKVPD